MSLSRFFFKVEEKYLGKLVGEGNIFWIYLRGQANEIKFLEIEQERSIFDHKESLLFLSFFFSQV